eukprot:1672283-Karenia_brevis.AAC.1
MQELQAPGVASSTWGAIHKINASKQAGSPLSNCGCIFLFSLPTGIPVESIGQVEEDNLQIRS